MNSIIWWFIIDSKYYVKVEYINVTDSNQSYPYILSECRAVECPFDIFTTIYQSRFPQSATVECPKKIPPSNFIVFYRLN